MLVTPQAQLPSGRFPSGINFGSMSKAFPAAVIQEFRPQNTKTWTKPSIGQDSLREPAAWPRLQRCPSSSAAAAAAPSSPLELSARNENGS